ncbi:MAG: hypothetical protein HY747_02845 [Elusimicrobia bacterium]|nr:hypothetical protein [Elusimicrobiota bacterium]
MTPPPVPIEPAPIPEPVKPPPPAPIEPPAPPEPQPPSIVPFPKNSAADILDTHYRRFARTTSLKEAHKDAQAFDKTYNEILRKFRAAQSAEASALKTGDRRLFMATQGLENEGMLFILSSQRKRLLGLVNAEQAENEEKIRYERYLSLRHDQDYLYGYLSKKIPSVWTAPIVDGQVALKPAEPPVVSPPEAPPEAPPPFKQETQASQLRWEGMGADLVSKRDGGLDADGESDGVFSVTLSGPVDSLILTTSDSDGNPMSGQQWDTLSGSNDIPDGFQFSYGNTTWILGVQRPDGTIVNLSGGQMPVGTVLPEGTYKLYAGNSQYFKPGVTFALSVIRLGKISKRLVTQISAQIQPVPVDGEARMPRVRTSTIRSFTANPTVIAPGQSVVLEWTTIGAGEVAIEPGIGKVGKSGTMTVSPENTITYRLSAKSAVVVTDIYKDGFADSTKEITVTVNKPASSGAPDVSAPSQPSRGTMEPGRKPVPTFPPKRKPPPKIKRY